MELLEKEEQRRVIEPMLRRLRRASDEEVLGMFESSQPPFNTRGDVAYVGALIGRGHLVLRALEQGVLSPDTRCGSGTLADAAAVLARWSC